MFGGKRWCYTTCALFMLCPRNFSNAASSQQRRSNSNKISVPKTLSSQGKSTDVVPRWSMNIFNDKETVLRVEDAEPGFDFNDEEIKKLKIWPGGAIPYYIDEFSFDKVFRDRLRSFLDATNTATGLNFLELPRPPGDDETRWVLFVNRQGLLRCVDHPTVNFTTEGVQKVVLGYDCLSGGGLAEVVLALVGVPPQHNAPDRNKYIEIMKDNILPGKTQLFEVLKNNEWLFHDISYDFSSAGHYSLHKYTKNGKATIKPLSDVQFAIGEGNGFSHTDIWKIQMMYNYISKNRLKSVSMPECEKLFNRGPNFNNYVHEPNENVQPRKKPNKYSGLSDKTEFSNNKETYNKTKLHNPNTNKDVSIEDNAELDSEKEQNIEEIGSNAKESNIKQKKSLMESNEDSVNQEVDREISDNNSQPQSDSEDNHKRKPQGLKFKKPGQG